MLNDTTSRDDHFGVADSGVASEELKQFVERIENLHEQRKAISDDISEIYAEAKGRGYCVKALKFIISRRRMDQAERAELESLVDLYLAAIDGASGQAQHLQRVRPKREAYQPYRIASLGDQKDAVRAGSPISGDTTFQEAFVYFAVSDCRTLMKVGVSNNVTKRIISIGKDRGVRMTLWFSLPGNRQEELRCLEALELFKIEGEWFRYCDGSVQISQQLREYYGFLPAVELHGLDNEG